MKLKRITFPFNGENFYAYAFTGCSVSMIKSLDGEEISLLSCSIELIQAADRAVESL